MLELSPRAAVSSADRHEVTNWATGVPLLVHGLKCMAFGLELTAVEVKQP